MTDLRDWLDGRPVMQRVFRIAVAVVGTAVLVLGIFMIPYPGPGWLVVFAGLGILALEFTWAERLLSYARARYDAWTEWLGRQHWSIKLLVVLGTCAIVLVTLWLLGAYWTIAGWLGLQEWTWLQSPFF